VGNVDQDPNRRYKARGRVVSTVTGQPVGGVRIELWDRDVVQDDCLGFAETDELGRFEVEFDDRAFRSGSLAALEKGPDLYVIAEGGLSLKVETSVLVQDAGATLVDLGVLRLPITARPGPGRVPEGHEKKV
jgi:hypothetical protein